MYIYVHSENKNFKYYSDIIPKKDEILYFPHFGSYKIEKIIYNISDDTLYNKLMFIDIYTSKVKEYETMA